MLEVLLEKILLKHFGRFLSGLDRGNIHLGVWSGNLLIENVGLRPEVIDMLELPLHLRFSHIEKFKVNVPWSKISQQPVEILIENVFVIVTQKHRNDWKLSFYKHVLIEQYFRKTVEEYLAKKAKLLSEKKEKELRPSNSNASTLKEIPISVDKQGIFDRLIAKVIDNIQIIIQNIHVRYENDLEKPGYCWGITLADLRIFTTDNSFKSKIFFDRWDPKNRDVFLYKMAELTKLGFYWNSNELQFFSNMSPSEICGKMFNFSLYERDATKLYSKRINYIVSINCELRCLINNASGTSATANSEVQLFLNLEKLNFVIRNSQLQDFIRMLEAFQQYQLAFAREKAKNKKKIHPPTMKSCGFNKTNFTRSLWKFMAYKAIVSESKKRFDQLFQTRILRKKGGIPCFSDSDALSKLFESRELKKFNKTISEIEVDELFKWVREAFLREELDRIYAKQRKFASGMVFCGSGSKGNLKKLQAYLESQLSPLGGEVQKSSKYLLNETELVMTNKDLEGGYILKSLAFELSELNIRLTKKLKKYDEGLFFRLQSLVVNLELPSNGLEAKAQIREIAIDLISNNDTNNEIVIPILKRDKESLKKHSNFLNLGLKKFPKSLDIKLELGSLEVVYYPSIMLKFLAYFSVQSSEEGVRNVALEEYRYLHSTATQQISLANEQKDFEFSIIVKVQSPTLIVPFLQYNDEASPCFVLLLGDIELRNEESNILGVFLRKDEIYQNFILRFSSIQLFFYSSITFFNLTKKYGELTSMPIFAEGKLRNEKFQIIEDLKLKARIQRIKGFSRERASLKTLIDFEPVKVNLSQKTFTDLMKFKRFFSDTDYRTQELLQTEMKPLFEHAYRKGVVRKKESTFKNWSSYFVIFNGGYLYFFISPKDLKYSTYLYIKDSVVRECASEIGVPFSFKITNKLSETYLACASHSDMKSWVKILQKKIHEFSLKTYQFSMVNNRKSEGVPKAPDYNLTTLSLHVRVPLLQLNFLDLLRRDIAVQLELDTLDLSLTQKLLDLELKLQVKSLTMKSFLDDGMTPPDNPILLLSRPQSADTLDLSLNVFEKNNPNYQSSDISCSLLLGKPTIYWKYKAFSYLLRFLMEEAEFNLESLSEKLITRKASKTEKPISFKDNPSSHLRPDQSLREFTKKLTIKRDELVEEPAEMRSLGAMEATVFALRLEIESLDIVCIVKRVPIAKFRFPVIDISLELKADESMNVKGRLKDLQIEDLTNYPETRLLETKQLSEIEETVFKKKILLPGNTIDFSYLTIDPLSPKATKNITSVVKCEIKGLKVLFFQQNFLRIIDFLNEDIVSTLTFDYKTPEPLKGDPRFLAFLLRKPRFSSIEVNLQETELILKSQIFDSREIRLSVREIKVKNFQERLLGRVLEKNNSMQTQTKPVNTVSREFEMEGLWSDNYAIELFDFALEFKDKADENSGILITNSTKIYDGSILVERLFMPDETEKILKEEFDVDKTMKVLLYFEAFELKFSYPSYQHFMSVLMNNLSFDDGFDAFFSKRPFAKTGKTPISLSLDFPLFKLTLETPHEEIKHALNIAFLPMIELSFIGNRLQYSRDSQGKALISLFSNDFLAQDYDFHDDGNESFKVTITSFLRRIAVETISLSAFMKTRRIQGFSLERSPIMRSYARAAGFDSEKIAVGLRSRVYNSGRSRFSLRMASGKDVEKKIELELRNAMFLFNARLAGSFLEYIRPREEKGSKVYDGLNFEGKKLLVTLELRNVLLFLQSSNEENVILIQTLIKIAYAKNREPFQRSHADLHAEIAEGGFVSHSSSRFETNKTTIDLSKIEVFTCNRADVFTEQPEDYDVWKLEIRKRVLAQSFSLSIERNVLICGCNRGKCWNLEELKVTGTGNLRANVSYKDFLLFYETSEFQSKEVLLEKSREKLRVSFAHENLDFSSSYSSRSLPASELSVNSEEQARVPRETAEKPWKTHSKNLLYLIFERIELILIDDIGKTLIPILQIILSLRSLESEKVFNKRITKGLISPSISYYNPASGRLEPILEPTNLIFGYIQAENGSPEKYLTLELENPEKSVNLNISEEMIAGLMKTYYSLTTELEVFRETLNSNLTAAKSNVPYQGRLLRKNTFSKKYYQDYMKYVSIYSITNQTGYDIELIRDEVSLGYTLNSQRNYNLGLSIRNNIDLSLGNRKLVLNSATENFEVHSDETDFERTFHSSHSISIKFQTFAGAEIQIRGIELNRVRTKRYNWTDGLFKGHFLAEVRTVGSRKNLKLSSQCLFRNFIDATLVLIIRSPRFKGHLIEIDKDQEKGCPCEYYEEMGSFQVKLATGKHEYYNASSRSSDKSDFSTPILSFSTLTKQLKAGPEFLRELSHSPHSSLLRATHEGEFSEKLVVSFNPCLRVTNCLPVPLELVSETGTRRLMPQEQFHDINRGLASQVKFVVKVPGYDFSRSLKVSAEDALEAIIPISLKSVSSEVLKDEDALIYMARKARSKADAIAVFFFSRTCIINKTYHLLDFWAVEKGVPKRIPTCSEGGREAYSTDSVALMNGQEKVMLGFKGYSHETSNEIDVKDVGEFVVELKSLHNNKCRLYEFGVSVKRKKAVHELELFTKTIEVSHRYITLNKTQLPLEIFQTRTNSSLILRPQERGPFDWSDCTKDKSIVVKIHDPEDESHRWLSSGPIDITASRSLSFVLTRDLNSSFDNPQRNQQDAEGFDTVYMKLDIVKVETSLFLSFQSMGPENYSYLLRNDTSSFMIRYRQSSVDLECPEFVLLKETSRPFAWTFPDAKPELEVGFLHMTEQLAPHKFVFNLDTIIESRNLILKASNYEFEYSFRIKVRTVIHGPTRVLQFYEPVEQEVQNSSMEMSELMIGEKYRRLSSMLILRKKGKAAKSRSIAPNEKVDTLLKLMQVQPDEVKEAEGKPQDRMKMMILVNFQAVGISLMSRNKAKVPVELAFITVKGVEFLLMEERIFKTLQFRTKFLNIDNNSDYRTVIPVVFTPSLKAALLEDRSRYFLDIFIKYNHTSKEILCFDAIRLEFESATIKIDEDFATLLAFTLESLNNILGGFEEDGETQRKKPINSIDLLFLPVEDFRTRTVTSQVIKNGLRLKTPEFKQSHEIFAFFDESQKNPFADWEWIEIPETNRYIYIKELIVSPLDFYLSFSRRISTSHSETSFERLASAFSKAFANIDEAPIHLQGFKLNFIFDTKTGITEKIIEHYKTSIVSTVLKVIGSINILGNPIGLYNYVKSGFVELIDRPRRGFVHGPLEAGLGVLVGAGCLIKQTFAGTFNSLHHISNSIATGLTVLSFDDSFIESRRKFKLKKPHNVLEGVDQGLHSIYSGLEQGVKGLFLKPYTGAKADGLTGLIKGTATGVSGLLLKPVTGICEATSKTAEGLKNTTVHFDDKANDERLRLPRVFYEREKYIKRYDELDAEVLFLLQEIKKGRFSKNTFFEAFSVNVKKDGSVVLILTREDILLYSRRWRKFYWKVRTCEIERIERKVLEEATGEILIRLWLRKKSKKGKLVEVKVKESAVRGEKSNARIYEGLTRMHEMHLSEEKEFLEL